MKHNINHNNGTMDARYSINKEFHGKEKVSFIIRFCTEWIGYASTPEKAILIGKEHQQRRFKELTTI